MENTIHLAILGVFRIGQWKTLSASLQVMNFIWHLCILRSSLKSYGRQKNRIRSTFPSDFFSQIPLELHISMAVFINFGWTKNFDHRPQTLCHPSGPSCQSVQQSYSIFQEIQWPERISTGLLASPWPATSNSPLFSHAPSQSPTGQLSASTDISEEVSQFCRWKACRKMCYAMLCDLGQEQNSCIGAQVNGKQTVNIL